MAHAYRFAIITALFFLASASRADDASIARELSGKGAQFKDSKGVITDAQIGDVTNWTDDDFKKLAQLTHLQMLSVSKGLTDHQLALLAPLTEVTYIQTNLIAITDEGTKSFSQFKKLRMLKFFHPNKTFTGVQLASLAALPELKSLTVAGSLSFGDEGMAAVAKLPLTEFRSWHAGQTAAGVAHLKAMKTLTNLNLGQRLAYKPPTTVSDEAVGILAEIPTLQVLQLSEAKLSLSALSKLKALANLKTLTLDGIEIPEADVNALKQQLPHVQVKWTKPDEKYIKRIKAMFPDSAAAAK